jgi:hypothetical protein
LPDLPAIDEQIVEIVAVVRRERRLGFLDFHEIAIIPELAEINGSGGDWRRLVWW